MPRGKRAAPVSEEMEPALVKALTNVFYGEELYEEGEEFEVDGRFVEKMVERGAVERV